MTNDAAGCSTYGPSGFNVIGVSAAPVCELHVNNRNTDITSQVYFTDTSLNTPQEWNWSFGDGTYSTEQKPYPHLTSYGTYTVSLTVPNLKGTDTITKTDYIAKITPYPPVASFTADVSSGVSPCQVQFTDTSTGTVTSWFWDFGDDVTSTEQNPVHWYALGTYSVTLTATNGAGEATVP